MINQNKNMNLREKDRRGKMVFAVLLLITVIGVGYAALGANLKINGVADIPASTWDVHFKTGSIAVTSGSVTGTNVTTAATITNATQVDYAVKLALPGDFYEFTVVAENTGTIDAMIDSVSSKLGTTEITTGTLPTYIDYSVTYADGIAIAPKHKLSKNTEETYKVRVAYKTDIEASELPQTAETLNLNFQINYVQADDTAVAKPVPSMENDSWEKIISNVQNNTIPSYYTVGSTKTVDMGTFGTHTLRVANNSTPAECATEGFSQTACGFVLEFADIITTHVMNSDNSGSTNGTGNKGGWEYSEMRTYVNNDIYNALPSALKSAIIDTNVVSGHGSKDTTNFTTTDKLYLLSVHEVWEDVDGNTSYGPDSYDTAYNNTRQLDYYKNNNVTTSSYGGAKKQYNGSKPYWWLRSARSSNYGNFLYVDNSGYWNNTSSSYTTPGVAPAFRIS